MIGILAYGSLISHPGAEIEETLVSVIRNVLTPFPVEYARLSKSRAGAPTLVPVPQGLGEPVNGAILVLRASVDEPTAENILYRRELHKVGDSNFTYDDQAQRKKDDGLVIEKIPAFMGLDLVLYTSLKPNFAEILEPQFSPQDKADFLARAAIASLTLETYLNGTDGIQYLMDNLQMEIKTALTEGYVAAVLRQAGGFADLAQVRSAIAREKGWF